MIPWEPKRINLIRRARPDHPILCSGFVLAGHRLLSLSDLRRSHSIDDSARYVAGVYFLWDDRRLVYVGSSANVLARATEHFNARRIDFNYATFLAIEFPWYLSVEAAYIVAYLPSSNATHTPRPRRDC
jgi:hypothetical protein